MTEAKRRWLEQYRRDLVHGKESWKLWDMDHAKYIDFLRHMAVMRTRYLHQEAQRKPRDEQIQMSRIIGMARDELDRLLRYDRTTGVYNYGANPRGSHLQMDK
jgi:acetylornithine/succinyldiaminopimelate/putrescine aminotransferase